MEGKGSAVGGSFQNRLCPHLLFPPIGMNSGLCVGLIYLFPSFAYRIEQRRAFSPAINIHHCLAVHTKGLNCHQAVSMLLSESREDVNSDTELTEKNTSSHHPQPHAQTGVFPLPANVFCPDTCVCIQMSYTLLCVRAACHLWRTGGIPKRGGFSYIRAIVPLPQLHVTSTYAAARLCSPSGPPSSPYSPALTSYKRNRPSAVSKYGCTQ